MSGKGTQSKITIRVAGTPVPARGGIQLSEDVYSGAGLSFQLEQESEPAARPGDLITIAISADQSDSDPVEHRLWVSDVHCHTSVSGSSFAVRGSDPFSFCSSATQFRTWQGSRAFTQILKDVLTLQPGALPSLPESNPTTPTVKPDWLFQCNETGRDFLTRLAAQVGQVLYWDRTAFMAGDIGRGPTIGGPTISLDFTSGLVDFSVHSAPTPHSASLAWTDPVTGNTHSETFGGRGIPGVATRAPLHARIGSAQRPAPAAYAAVNRIHGTVVSASAVTTRPDLRLGSLVKFPDGTTMMVQHIEHMLHARGSYSNEIFCVPAELWAFGSRTPRHCMTGPYTAIVSDNNDPLRQGRIRVTLAEDSERRSSHWIPVTQVSSGPGLGVHWIPEKDDLVLVLAEADCPENLKCIGSVRGDSQKIDSKWSSDANAVKVFEFRNGTRIQVDDQQGILLLQCGSSSIELCTKGDITIKGKQVLIETSERTEIQGGQETKVDSQIINLG